MTAAGQRNFDFDATERTGRRQAELDAFLDDLGLSTAERRIVAFIWRHGTMMENRSAVMISQPKLARAIGYSVRWTIESIHNLAAFEIVRDASNGPGRPNSYLVDWRRVRTMEPVRAAVCNDPYTAFETPALTTAVGSEVTTAPTPAQSPAVTPAQTPAVDTAQHPQNTKQLNPQDINIKSNSEGPERGTNWGREVRPEELLIWEGRTALWRLARQINPDIDANDHDDRVGFIAACLCASEKANKSPAGMLLTFVKRRAWRTRGNGGIDGFWIGKASTLLRERQRERDRQHLTGANA